MKKTIRKIIARILGNNDVRCKSDEPVAQKTLMQQYRVMASTGVKNLPALGDVGFRKYSQFEEDGKIGRAHV